MDSSIAFHVARIAQQEGAEVVLTSFGRTMRITQTIAKRLPKTPPVIELDVSNAEDFDLLSERVREHVDGLDGVAALHRVRARRPRWAATSSRPSGTTSPPPCRSLRTSLKALAVGRAAR